MLKNSIKNKILIIIYGKVYKFIKIFSKKF